MAIRFHPSRKVTILKALKFCTGLSLNICQLGRGDTHLHAGRRRRE